MHSHNQYQKYFGITVKLDAPNGLGILHKKLKAADSDPETKKMVFKMLHIAIRDEYLSVENFDVILKYKKKDWYFLYWFLRMYTIYQEKSIIYTPACRLLIDMDYALKQFTTNIYSYPKIDSIHYSEIFSEEIVGSFEDYCMDKEFKSRTFKTFSSVVFPVFLREFASKRGFDKTLGMKRAEEIEDMVEKNRLLDKFFYALYNVIGQPAIQYSLTFQRQGLDLLPLLKKYKNLLSTEERKKLKAYNKSLAAYNDPNRVKISTESPNEKYTKYNKVPLMTQYKLAMGEITQEQADDETYAWNNRTLEQRLEDGLKRNKIGQFIR